MRIYFCGASGVGKTTLAKVAAEASGLPILESVGRQVTKRWQDAGMAIGQILTNPAVCSEFQKEIFAGQLAAEAQTKQFVSDRCIDHVAYAAERATNAWEIVRSAEWKTYVDSLCEKDVLLFFVRPSRAANEQARLETKRGEFLDWDEVQRTDGVTQFILETNELTYIPVVGESLRPKVRLVDGLVRKFKKLL